MERGSQIHSRKELTFNHFERMMRAGAEGLKETKDQGQVWDWNRYIKVWVQTEGVKMDYCCCPARLEFQNRPRLKIEIGYYYFKLYHNASCSLLHKPMNGEEIALCLSGPSFICKFGRTRIFLPDQSKCWNWENFIFFQFGYLESMSFYDRVDLHEFGSTNRSTLKASKVCVSMGFWKTMTRPFDWFEDLNIWGGERNTSIFSKSSP